MAGMMPKKNCIDGFSRPISRTAGAKNFSSTHSSGSVTISSTVLCK